MSPMDEFTNVQKKVDAPKRLNAGRCFSIGVVLFVLVLIALVVLSAKIYFGL
jgi:hypothetical protein